LEEVSVRKRFLRFNTLIGLLLAAAVIYFFFTRFDIHRATAILSHSNLPLLALAGIVFYGSLPLRGYRWGVLLGESGITAGTVRLTRLYFLAWFVNSILPARIGDIYRAYLLKKSDGVSFPLSLGVLFSERVFDLGSTGLLVVLSGVFYLGQIASMQLRNYITTSLFAIGVIVVRFIAYTWRSAWLVEFLPRSLKLHYESFTQGIFRSPWKIPVIAAQSLIIWLSEAGRLYFAIWAVGGRVDFLLSVFVSQAALILMSLPLTPAGLGLVELLMLTMLVPTGFSPEAAAAVVIADRLISYWSLIILGGLHYALASRYR